MERKKQYNEKQVQQDLYQYEMGIELGAEVEEQKQQHQNEYQKDNQCRDYKSNNNQSNNSRSLNKITSRQAAFKTNYFKVTKDGKRTLQRLYRNPARRTFARNGLYGTHIRGLRRRFGKGYSGGNSAKG